MKIQKITVKALMGVIGISSIVLSGSLSAETKFGELTVLADKYGTDKGNKTHKYTEVYELFFLPYKNTATKIFEIGVFGGAGMKMFRDYFPNAQIHGIDIYDMSKYNSKRLKTYIADQSKRDQLQKVMDESKGEFDIILDDGGHTMEQQQVSIGYLFQHVKPGGLYIIEDVHTSKFGADFGVNEDASNSTLKMINTYIYDGSIKSEYLTPEEMLYLEKHIEYCNLVSRNNGDSISCLIKKRSE